MADNDMQELGKMGPITCYSTITHGNDNTFGRVIIDDKGDTMTKSTRTFEDIELCKGDLVNTFKKLQKMSHDHVMGELEY